MTTVLNWGLLGTGRINRSLIPALRSSSRAHLKAVASRDAARAAEYASTWQIPESHGSYDALLADPSIHAIYNSLPNALHAEWTIRAVQAGKHVLCEKPMALSVDEIDAIAQAASGAGRIVTEAFMYRHHPQTLRVKELLEAATVGSVLTIRSAFTFTLTRVGDVRLDPSLGGGSLWDVGCYPVSISRFLVGREPSRVVGWQRCGESGTDDVFVGMLDFDGPLAQFDCGFRAPFRTVLEIVGTDGIIEVPTPFKPGPSERILIRRGDATETIEVSSGALYLGEVEDFTDAVLLGRAPRVSFADSRGNTQTLVALYESARIGRAVQPGLVSSAMRPPEASAPPSEEDADYRNAGS